MVCIRTGSPTFGVGLYNATGRFLGQVKTHRNIKSNKLCFDIKMKALDECRVLFKFKLLIMNILHLSTYLCTPSGSDCPFQRVFPLPGLLGCSFARAG